MRLKHKRPLALALTITIINLLILFYDAFPTNTSADILRSPAIIDKMGPGLPPDDFEEAFTKRYYGQESFSFNTTILKNISQTDGLVRSRDGADKFLIHSYLRSGSSKVAEALNLHHREIFYFHHPLQPLDNSPSSGLSVLKNTKATKGVDWLKAIYNCSFENRKQYITEPEIWKSHAIRHTFKKDCHNLEITECLEKSCKSRSLRAVSTIRLGMDFIYQMMKLYGQKFKVIMVLRDPRSILGSRQLHNIGSLKTTEDFKQQASTLCKTMGRDVLYAEHIKKIMPGSILIFHYEHLILHPNKALPYLYDFLGLEVSDSRIQEVIAILGLQVSEDQRLQMTKDWQVQLTLQESRAIDRGCKFQYKNLGYFPVPSKLEAYDKYFIRLDQIEAMNYDYQ